MKKFIIKTTLYMIPIALVSIYVWLFGYESWTGDFGRLGKIPFGKYDTVFHRPEFNHVVYIYNPDSIKYAHILTIGDSFSQQSVYGYQNYLGEALNTTIYNFHNQYASTPEELTIELIKQNKLAKGTTVIVESVERAFIGRLNNCFSEKKYPIQFYGNRNDAVNLRNKPSKLTIEEIFSFVRLSLGYDVPYKKMQLNGNYFTHQKYGTALFVLDTKDDSELPSNHVEVDSYAKAIKNLNLLHKYANKQEINLIYLVCVDKYDLYYEQIEDNPYPANKKLSYFSKIDTIWFVNSKQILKPYIILGEQDIFRCNDTHWSPIAAKYVAEEIANRIKGELYK